MKRVGRPLGLIDFSGQTMREAAPDRSRIVLCVALVRHRRLRADAAGELEPDAMVADVTRVDFGVSILADRSTLSVRQICWGGFRDIQEPPPLFWRRTGYPPRRRAVGNARELAADTCKHQPASSASGTTTACGKLRRLTTKTAPVFPLGPMWTPKLHLAKNFLRRIPSNTINSYRNRKKSCGERPVQWTRGLSRPLSRGRLTVVGKKSLLRLVIRGTAN
jgi:hypothetical protein